MMDLYKGKLRRYHNIRWVVAHAGAILHICSLKPAASSRNCDHLSIGQICSRMDCFLELLKLYHIAAGYCEVYIYGRWF